MKGKSYIRADEIVPGQKITFGDHTGWYRVRAVSRPDHRTVVIRFWFRRTRNVTPETSVWIAS